jgi:hypothetical protein
MRGGGVALNLPKKIKIACISIIILFIILQVTSGGELKNPRPKNLRRVQRYCSRFSKYLVLLAELAVCGHGRTPLNKKSGGERTLLMNTTL